MSEEQKVIDERLRTDLFSSNEKTVLSALAEIGEDGSRAMVEPVLELLARTDSEDVKQIILDQLSQLKISEMEELFIGKIQSDDFSEYHKELVFCMWHSGMNPVNHVHVFAKLAVEGDYMMAIEVMTLLENLEGPFDHESVIEAFSDVSVYITESSVEDPKLDLMKSIYEILHLFQEEG